MIRLLAVVLASLSASAARAADCALALALALDISSSVNEWEYEIQKGGLAAALRHPEVRAAILESPGEVRIAVYEWSGWQQQDLIVGWTPLRSNAEIDALAARIDAHRRRYAEFSTAIGAALVYGARLFDQLRSPCLRRVIDISGDGVNNSGAPPRVPQAAGVLDDLVVNGLVIKGASPDPEGHYLREVIWGTGAFVMVARNGFEDYPDMILGKLLREIRPPLFIGAASVGSVMK